MKSTSALPSLCSREGGGEEKSAKEIMGLTLDLEKGGLRALWPVMSAWLLQTHRQLVEGRTVNVDTHRNVVVDSSEFSFNFMLCCGNWYATLVACAMSLYLAGHRECARTISTRSVTRSTDELWDHCELSSTHFRWRVVARILNSH